MLVTDKDNIARKRRELHDKLDEILDGKDRWDYPLVVTVTVESPIVRKLLRAADQHRQDGGAG